MKKEYCESCKFLKYIDSEGMGYCDLLQETDVNIEDEACVEFVQRECYDESRDENSG